MSRQKAPVEVTSYVKGLVTEASPLTFPENASVDEVNFVLNRDGTRRRRLGMDVEPSYASIDTGISPVAGLDIATTSFKWIGAGGVATKNISVVQVGNTLMFFDLDVLPLSTGLIHSKTYPSVSINTPFSMANVDSILVVTTGEKDVTLFTFDGTSTITESTVNLAVRDLFGVEDIEPVTGDNLRNGSNVSKRVPIANISDTHVYNLRNQTWGEARMYYNDSSIRDPIQSFQNAGGNTLPSNSDTVTSVLYANANISSNRTALRFHHIDLLANPSGTSEAPRGAFIIDVMDRGQSRINEVTACRDRALANGASSWIGTASLPVDSTPGGASVVAEYAGRAWYAGFPSVVNSGDSHSPKLGSYLLFSQLVKDSTALGRCYQEADPTSFDQSDLVDTDGGFIRIDGATGIKRLVNLGSALVVLAENGVWTVSGGSDYGFTATNYLVTKITDRGIVGPSTAVLLEDSLVYWGVDGIYHIARSEVGEYKASNITSNTIQTFYNNIGRSEASFASGVYDSFEKKVRWVYGDIWSTTSNKKELVLDLTLGAFAPLEIKKPPSSNPRVYCPVEVPPYTTALFNEAVLVGTDQVQSLTEDVEIEVVGSQDITRSVYYLTILTTSPTITYTFSSYRDTTFTDWKLLDGVGTDANAYLITGYMSGGDFLRTKQVPYIQFYFNRTETGFKLEGGDIVPTGESSCKVKAQWEWANSAASGKWGREFQAYRYRRLYLPEDVTDDYDSGFRVIRTRNKIRGKGKVLSLFIYTEPQKDMHLLGWSMVMEMGDNV